MRSINSCFSGCKLRRHPARLEQFFGTLGRQRIDPQLAIVGLTAPAMLVFRTIIDEKKKRRSGQAIDQAVQERLGLRIDPMQIFEDQEQRLNLALAQEQTLDRVQGALAALDGSRFCHC